MERTAEAADRVTHPVRRSDPFSRTLSWMRGWSPLVQDAVVTGLVFVFQVFALYATVEVDGTVLGSRRVDPLAFVLVAASTLPLMVRRRFPLTALVLCLAGLLAFVGLDYETNFTGYAVLAALYSVVVYRGLRVGLIGGLVAIVGANVIYTVADVEVSAAVRALDLLVVATGIALGDGTRNRMAAQAEKEARLAQLAEEHELQARNAVTEERTRIARELHDLVAHSMSVVAVQAGMGHHLIDSDPAKAKEALGTIERTSRQALTEMRRMLGVLRTEGDASAAQLGPQPGLGRLDALLGEVRDAGLAVDLHLTGEPTELGPTLDLTAFRIIQEALTNVLKHAGPAKLRIDLEHGPDRLSIIVDDDGRGAAAQPSDHVGMGLVGMRERAAVVGGRVAAGPRPGGGWRVTAELPYGTESS